MKYQNHLIGSLIIGYLPPLPVDIVTGCYSLLFHLCGAFVTGWLIPHLLTKAKNKIQDVQKP